MEDSQLVKALKSGDRKAFSVLYKRYWGNVFHFSKLYMDSKEHAEDIVQEVFIRIWESKDFLKEDDNFKGLLFITTRNLIFNQFRKNLNEDFYKKTVLEAMEESYNIEDDIDAHNLSEYINLLIEELPEKRREVFKLSRKEHKSHKEIALLLNISEKTVENQIREAIKFLRLNIKILVLFI